MVTAVRRLPVAGCRLPVVGRRRDGDRDSEEATVGGGGDPEPGQLTGRERLKRQRADCDAGRGFLAPPQPGHVAADDDRGLEHAVVARHDHRRMLGGQAGAAVLVAQQELVEPGQGMHPPRRAVREAGRHPVADLVDDELLKVLTGEGHPDRHVADRKLCPPGEIAQGRRSVAGEVAPHELPQRLLAVEPAGAGDPLVEEDDGLVVAAHRAKAELAGLVELPDQVRAALTSGGDPGRLESLEELGAGRGPATLEQLGRNVPGLAERRVVQAEFAVPGQQRAQRPLPRELQHPPDIDGGYQVQGAAHRP
jgi:hypothetical protein